MNNRKNFLMEQLYDMASSKEQDPNGLSKFDEAKLRKELEGNKKFMAKNKNIFAEGEPRFYTCRWYEPCAICDKCKNKASHLYVRCQNCQIPICVHTHKNITTMIKRKNFTLGLVSKDTIEKFRKLGELHGK